VSDTNTLKHLMLQNSHSPGFGKSLIYITVYILELVHVHIQKSRVSLDKC